MQLPGEDNRDSPMRPHSSSLERGPAIHILVDIDPKDLVLSLSIFVSIGSLSSYFGNKSRVVLPNLPSLGDLCTELEILESSRNADEVSRKDPIVIQRVASRRVLVLESLQRFILFARSSKVKGTEIVELILFQRFEAFQSLML